MTRNKLYALILLATCYIPESVAGNGGQDKYYIAQATDLVSYGPDVQAYLIIPVKEVNKLKVSNIEHSLNNTFLKDYDILFLHKDDYRFLPDQDGKICDLSLKPLSWAEVKAEKATWKVPFFMPFYTVKKIDKQGNWKLVTSPRSPLEWAIIILCCSLCTVVLGFALLKVNTWKEESRREKLEEEKRKNRDLYAD